MKKKFWLVLLALVSVLCLCFGLAACGKNGDAEKGADGHTHIAEHFQVDENGHWKVCTVCGEKFSVGNHSYNSDNACKTCGYNAVYTKGLKYTLDEETDTYTVEGLGEATGTTDLIIPAYHEGKAVTSIGYYAFYECSGLTSIVIPDSVTSIGYDAFLGCYGLTGVYITDLATRCNIDFGNASANPLYYAYHLYLDGEEVKEFIVPKGVTEIKAYTFSGCSGLESVTIGNGVTEIGSGAFSYCNGLTDIQFRGTVKEWQTIIKGSNWNNGTPDYTVTCTDGTVDKKGNVTYFED